MNETNIKHGYNKPTSYSLMVRDARGALWNPWAQFSKAGAAFMTPGRNIEVRGAILGPPGAGFFNYVSSGGGTCQVMHSGLIFNSSIDFDIGYS